ncbi:MAG: DUF5718 family protein [Thermoleophilia bacterium]
MIDLALDDLRAAAGIGVAGNFAGHLEQAGEAADFAGMQTAGEAPKGIFPWYVPGADGFLGAFPLSHDRLELPDGDGPANLQIEPEVGVLFRLAYAPDGGVEAVAPVALGAFNDCSIRRPGAAKISHKKNWGPASKGVARRVFPVTDLSPAGATASFRLACFLRRDGATREYGIDSPLPGYTYYGDRLLAWIADRLRGQAGAPGTPLEPVGEYLAAAGRPATALVGIGATRYTDVGESTYLQAGDESVVVVYDAAASGPEAVAAAVAAGTEGALPRASVLCQRVHEAAATL